LYRPGSGNPIRRTLLVPLTILYRRPQGVWVQAAECPPMEEVDAPFSAPIAAA